MGGRTMPDSLEIEGKYRVVSLGPLRKRLRDLHIVPREIEDQRDVYYASPNRDFARTDEALRVRYGTNGVTLTYKGPRLPVHGMKSREEVNVRVDSGKDLEIILQRLGLSPSYTVEKKREIYDWNGVEIGLDEVQDLGTFVEIEVKGTVTHPEERIEDVKRSLKIEGEHIPQSYLELLRAQTERSST
jgi:adenylate cyclase class 2